MSGEPEIMSSADAADADGTADANHQNPQQLPQQEQRLGTPTMQMIQGGTKNVGGGDHLLNMLRAQVEYYFSAQNLGRDSYLRNMLSSEQARQQQQQQHRPPPPSGMQLVTPIEVIANFPKVWNICSSFAANAGQPPEPPAVLIVKALQGSSIVTISSDGAWIGPTSQQLPPFTGSAPPSPSPSGMPPATITAQQQQFLHQQNLSPYPPPQMMVIPMQQPDGTIVHQSFPPPPYFMGPPPPPATATSSINSNNNNNRQATEGGGGGTDSATASLEDGSIPSQMKASSSKISVNSASAASLSSLSEQQPQVQMIQQAQQQQQQFGGPMMGQAGQPPLPPPPPGPGGYPMSPLPPHMQQFIMPPYGVPMPPYPPYYNPQQMYPPNFMPPPPPPPPPGGNGSGPPPRGVGFPPPPYPYPGMPSQFMGDGGYPSPYPPHPHGYPPRHNQPNIGDNRKGGGGGSFDGQKKHNNQKKKNRNNNNNFEMKQRGNDNNNYGNRSPNFGQQQGYGGSAPSSPYFNNRHQKQYHHKKGGHDDNHHHHHINNEGGGGGGGKVFTSSDFPGLDGKAAIEGSTQVKATTPSDDGKKLSGYASALLKKNEDKKDDDGSIGKEVVAPSKPIENGDDDNIAQQTAAMEKEILSEFHDLSFAGKNEDAVEHDRNSPSKKHVAMAADDKTDGYTVETSPSSTTDNGAMSPQSNNGNSLPKLQESATKSPKATVQEPIPIVHLETKGHEESSSPVLEQQQQHNAKDDKGVDNSLKPQCTEVEKPKPEPPAAWGSKRLFIDVLASQNK